MVLVSTIQKCSLNSRKLSFESTYSREWKVDKVLIVESEDEERKGKSTTMRYK